MALQVWLPLNGDLKNKGCDSDYDVPSTNYAVWANDGKIGNKSLYATTTTSGVLGYSKTLTNDHSYSICAWLKNSDETTGSRYILWTGSDSGSVGFGMRLAYGTPSVVQCLMFGYTIEVTIGYNSWHHICMVIDYEHLSFSVYLDGIFVDKKTYAINTVSNYGINIGWLRPSYYPFKGQINDVRIYDHCLSPAEVKAISRGLILHYKLNIIEPNILGNNGNIISGSDASGITRTYMSDGSVKFEVSSGNSNYSSCLCSQNDKNNFGEKLKAGDEITVSCDLFIESGSGIPQVFLNQGNSYMRLQGNSTLIGKWQRVYYNRTLSEFGTQYGNLSWHFGWSGLSGVFYVKHLKIERHATSNPIFTSDTEITKIIDDSGYGHHGSVTGSLFTNLETPRYNKCLDFESSKITSENLNLPGDSVFTISCWIKLLESKTYQPIFWIGDGTTGHGICAHGNGAGRLEGGDGTNKFDKNLINIGLNTWTHIAIVYNGTEIKQYLNGVLSNNFVSYTYGFGNTLTRLYIGYFWGGYCSSDISDFRIYSTALSADDILQLYKVSAKIDNLGNVHSYEINEYLDEGRELLVRNITGGYTNTTSHRSNSLTFNGNSSAGSEYIEINPTGKKYIYDFTLSVAAGNQFDLGFERYDANKTARGNQACVYVYATKSNTDIVEKRFKGVVDLSTDGVNPCKYIRLRILNAWSGSDSGTAGTATVHQLSLREVSTSSTAKTRLLKTGAFETDLLREGNVKAVIEKDVDMNINKFIEI